MFFFLNLSGFSSFEFLISDQADQWTTNRRRNGLVYRDGRFSERVRRRKEPTVDLHPDRDEWSDTHSWPRSNDDLYDANGDLYRLRIIKY